MTRGTMQAALTFEELLDYRDEETAKWKAFFEKHPQALDAACDIAKTKNIREMLRHIFAVELRYSERLAGLDVTDMNTLPTDFAGLFSISERASSTLRELISQKDDAFWAEVAEYPSVRASRRRLFAHALVHGIRHWAQLAVELRKAGYATDWPHDLLFSKAMD